MDTLIITAAVPIFFLLIGVEAWVARRAPEPRFSFSDTSANIAVGIGYQVLGLLTNAAMFASYVFLYRHLRVATLGPRTVAGWLALLIAVDFCYYWYHRTSHRVNLLWAMHVVHHQSEEYNLSVNLRQAWLNAFAVWSFYAPLAILGFEPRAILTMVTINALYQYWLHTRLVGRVGALERVLNTPSHHRVHHGIDRRYLDKNYGGIFIVWDRLFGTFRVEDEEPAYGIVKPLRSFNPLWANLHRWAEMGRMMRRAGTLGEALRVPFMPPEWLPRGMGGPPVIPDVQRANQPRYQVAAAPRLRLYVVGLIVTAMALMSWALLGAFASRAVELALCAAVLGTIAAAIGLLEARRWARGFEYARLLAVAALVVALLPRAHAAAAGVAVALATLAGLGCMWRLLPVPALE